MTVEAWGISAEGQHLLNAAMQLPEREREILADRLHASIDSAANDPEWEKCWSAELDRREAELENGETAALSLDDVRQMMRDARHGKMGS